MRPSQGPSFSQTLIYDISSQRFGIYSLFIGIPCVGLLFYGLFSKSFGYIGIGLVGLLVSFWEITRLIGRFHFFQKIYENGETIRITLDDVTQHGDEINAGGQYIHKGKEFFFWTTLQKTGRTKNLAMGDQVWLVIDQENPEDAYIQDLFTPDSPEEIRQPYVPDERYEKRHISDSENVIKENGISRIKISVPTTENNGLLQSSISTGGAIETQSRHLTVRDFQLSLLLIGIVLILVGIFLSVRWSESRVAAIVFGIVGLLLILSSLGSTIAIDKDAGFLSIKSIWRRDAVKIPLSELLDIQVEARESDDGGTLYRLIAIKTDGTIIPFRDSYTSGLSSYKRRAIQLCSFIGTTNQ